MNKRLLGAVVAAAASAALMVPSAAFAQGGPGGGGSGRGHGGGESTLGNNLSTPLVFAEGVGLGGASVPAGWTTAMSQAGDWTGLRGSPTPEEVLSTTGLTEPIKDEPYASVTGGPWYLQNTVNYWRAPYTWTNSTNGKVPASAAWGDNLTSASLTTSMPIRVEVALTTTIPATRYFYMQNLAATGTEGRHTTEVWATNGDTSGTTTTAAVYTRYACLTITSPTGAQLVSKCTDVTVEGPGAFAAEVNASGTVVYGYNWLAAEHPTAGTYTLTFSLKPDSNVELPGSATSVTKTVTITGSTVKGHRGGKGH